MSDKTKAPLPDEEAVERAREAIWNTRRDHSDYTLRMSLSFDEATHAAQSALASIPSTERGLRDALEKIARQKMKGELKLYEVYDVDWQTGFETCVKIARAALAAAPRLSGDRS